MKHTLRQLRHNSQGYDVLLSKRLICSLLRPQNSFTKSFHPLRHHVQFCARSILCPENNTALQKLWGHNSLHLYLKASQYSTYNNDSATIFALSTAPGRAAIAIVRLSGSACLEVSMVLYQMTDHVLICSRFTELSVQMRLL